MEQYRPNLGELCHEGARRDAVHIALAPVVAGEDLEPGWDVGVIGAGNEYIARTNVPHVGVVDPTLRHNGILLVKQSEVFWLWLYPNTVTDLRHAWSHEAFRVQSPVHASFLRDESHGD